MVTTIGFGGAADEYLRLITRTRPWSKRAEEVSLEAFGKWLHERAPDRPLALDELQTFAQQWLRGLHLGQRGQHEENIERFLAWALASNGADTT